MEDKKVDYEKAYARILNWLCLARDSASRALDETDDEEVSAKLRGYLECCETAIVVANGIVRSSGER